MTRGLGTTLEGISIFTERPCRDHDYAKTKCRHPTLVSSPRQGGGGGGIPTRREKNWKGTCFFMFLTRLYPRYVRRTTVVVVPGPCVQFRCPTRCESVFSFPHLFPLLVLAVRSRISSKPKLRVIIRSRILRTALKMHGFHSVTPLPIISR